MREALQMLKPNGKNHIFDVLLSYSTNLSYKQISLLLQAVHTLSPIMKVRKIVSVTPKTILLQWVISFMMFFTTVKLLQLYCSMRLHYSKTQIADKPAGVFCESPDFGMLLAPISVAEMFYWYKLHLSQECSVYILLVSPAHSFKERSSSLVINLL